MSTVQYAISILVISYAVQYNTVLYDAVLYPRSVIRLATHIQYHGTVLYGTICVQYLTKSAHLPISASYFYDTIKSSQVVSS